MTHTGFCLAAFAALMLTGCDSGSPPADPAGGPSKNAAAGRGKLPDLAAVPTAELCGEHVADSGAAGIAVDPRLPPCAGCSFEGGAAALDRDYETTARLHVGAGTEGQEFAVRVQMPAGFIYSGRRRVGAAVTEPRVGTAGAYDVRVRTYLHGVLQEDLNIIGLGIRGGGGSFRDHTATASLPFDAMEYVFSPRLVPEPVTVALHEFCANPEL